MRTKILLTAVAALAVGMVSSNAQVLSANVVGYVNKAAPGTSSYTFMNNPLDYGPQSNTVQNLFGSKLAVGSAILTWDGTTFSVNSYVSSKTGNAWSSPNATLPPGKGFVVQNAGGGTVTNAFVGQVEQGNLVNTNFITPGYTLFGSQYPVPGGITTTFGYTPVLGDTVYTWNGTTYSLNQYVSSKTGNAWNGGEPQIQIGVGYFLYTSGSGIMSNTFNVQ